jgi:hypothetical protein
MILDAKTYFTTDSQSVTLTSTTIEMYVEDASVNKTTRTSSDRQQQGRSSRLVSRKKKYVDCITGITSTNKIVHRLLSRIICVVVIIEPTQIHSIAYIHHPATLTVDQFYRISPAGVK